MMSFHSAEPLLLVVSSLLFLGGLLVKMLLARRAFYEYSLASTLASQRMTSAHPYEKILTIMRLVTLALLVFLTGKPQKIDERSKAPVEGIDIILALDVSESMQHQDFEEDQRSRFQIAQDEAIRFVNARPHDAIGLVLFGKDVLPRCPLTYDKKMLVEIIRDTRVGVIDPRSTVIARALVTAANRLKHSTAKSKIIILLTDGAPQQDIDPNIAIAIARQLGIKIYTVGIGNDKPVQLNPFFMVPSVDQELLGAIAQKTGGQFFLAKNPGDMRKIYDTIDTLEKTATQAPVYTRYHDIYFPFLLFALGLCIGEIFMRATMWFGL